MALDHPTDDDIPFSISNGIRIANELKAETDRGAVLVIAAFLDDLLRLLLKRHFNNDDKVVNELLSKSGPLGTFASRIKLAYCLDLIRRELYADLQTVRKIRNEFAHTHEPANFGADRIRDLVGNFGYVDSVSNFKGKLDFASMFDDPASTRSRFVAGSIALICGLTVCTSNSKCGVIDAMRFVERDKKETGGERLRKLIDEQTLEAE